MRVLLVTDVYAPSVGGTERHVEALAAALDRRGHDVVVATTSPALGGPTSTAGAPTVVRLRGWTEVAIRRRARPEQVFHPPAPDPPVVRALEALIRAQRIDVVHAHGPIAHSAVPAARQAGRPVVVSLHDYGLDCARRSRVRPDGSACAGTSGACWRCATATAGTLRGPLLVAGLRRSARWWPDVDAFVANSEAVGRAAAAAGVACEVISPWIAPGPDASGEPLAGLPATPFVAYVGALARHKGIEVLDAAWRDAPAPLVALVSRPELGVRLRAATPMASDVDHATVLATLARAAVTVVPSTYAEPFGLVAAEAMWAGSPVVASDVGGLAMLVGEAGVLVPPGDPSTLRRAVIELLDDPERRAELAAAGRRRVAELDGTDRLVRCYERVAAQPQASPASLRT